MKALERGGLQEMDRAVTTFRLPQRFRGGGTHFLANTELRHHVRTRVRISLEVFERNPPQPRELT